MAKPKKPMKGVTCREQGSTIYWYASIDGARKYCGAGNKGREIAIAAKAKDIAERYEKKEVTMPGLWSKRSS